jgi:hypothetical protein
MRYLLFIFLAITPFYNQAQEQFTFTIDEFQTVVDPSTSLQSQMRFPMGEKVIVMGGLDNLDGVGNYFNVFGSKLIIDRRKTTSDGVHTLTLRREDGREFFDLFETLTAKLTPMTHKEKIELPTP